MLVELTYACNMGCTHCLSDCKPNGEHMSIDTFKDVLKFMVNHTIPTWMFSGGEMFEHPEILTMLDMIESAHKDICNTIHMRLPITFITNGRELVRNKTIYNAVADMQKRLGKSCVLIQVTDDPRFYPDPLSDKEKYWLKKLNAIVNTVPNNPNDKTSCLYPQGRALTNFPDANWNTIGPKCANCILIAKCILIKNYVSKTTQTASSPFTELVNYLFSIHKFCTPVIAPNGDIKIGESALCPAVANIYQTDTEIMKGIRHCKCHQCTIPWNKLKETNPSAYQMLTD